jgi:hypothetical protein
MAPSFQAEDRKDTRLPATITPEPTSELVPEAVLPSAHLVGSTRPTHPVSQRSDNSDTNSVGLVALRLGFVALTVTGAVVLVALGYPTLAVIEVILGAGLAAVEILRRLG